MTHAAPEPLWRLRAYHLHRHTDVTTASPTTTPVLLSERDLLTDTCAIDTTVTTFAVKKSAAALATTQSIALYKANFSAVATVAERKKVMLTAGRQTSPFSGQDSGMPESAASAAVRRRDAAVSRYRTLGVIDLGVFQAEAVDVAKAEGVGAAVLADLEGEDDAEGLLPRLTDPGDETEHAFEVSIFLGDFTRTLCVSAALYANRADAGNVSTALAVFVPHSVSPSCAMRLSPHLRKQTGLMLTEEDALPAWPLPLRRRCRLANGHHFTFAFTPSLAQAKRPAFCAYEQVGGTAAAAAPGTRRQVSCALFLDVQLYTWYDAALAAMEADAVALKVAAAVTEVKAPSRTSAIATLGTQLAHPEYVESQPLKSPALDANCATTLCAAAEELRFAPSVAVVPLAGAANSVGGISRYKGTLWCTKATVGAGFWRADVAACVEELKAQLKADTDDPRQRRAFVRDCLLMALVAAAVAGFSGVLTGRVIKTARISRRRVLAGR